MADTDDEDETGPVVELGEGDPVEGAPLARVASRLTWGIEKSRLTAREGDAEIRTPDGPKRLGDVLESVDAVYFPRRQDFEDAVWNALGTGPVPTAEGERDSADHADTASASTDGDSGGDADADADTDTDTDVDSNGGGETDAESGEDDASANGDE